MMTLVRTSKRIFFVTYHYNHFFKIPVPEYINVLYFENRKGLPIFWVNNQFYNKSSQTWNFRSLKEIKRIEILKYE